ncbi:MAG TPA: AAA family ATPase [Geobacteraceae bacterium]
MTQAPSKDGVRTLPGVYKPSSHQKQSFGICIYGRGGVGKTTLIGTMPGKGLVIDVPQIEGGTFVLEDHADRIDIVPVNTWNDINEIYWYLAKEKHSYQWVAVDSITAMTELAKRKTLTERDLSMDAYVISLQEWGKVGRLVGELIYKFRVLPVHTIWVAQQRSFGGASDEVGGEGMSGPDVSPSALQALLPSMLLVGKLSVEPAMDGSYERHLRIGPNDRCYTKCRAKPGVDVPAVIRNPNLNGILRYILGHSTERPEEVDEDVIIIG